MNMFFLFLNIILFSDEPCKKAPNIIYVGNGINEKMMKELIKIIDIALDTIKTNLNECAIILRN